MIKLYEVQGKTPTQIENGAYYRCFGNIAMAQVLSRVQSLIIKNGYELERMITELTDEIHVADLDDFLSRQIMPKGTMIVTKRAIRNCNTIQGRGIEPDFMVFQHVGSSQMCYVIELKDGHEFDTKSSAKEYANLRQFISLNADPLRYYQVYTKIVGFNARNREEIRVGFKNKINLRQAMTGKEFCDLLEIGYEKILATRARDREVNFDSLVKELAEIPEVREAIKAESSI